jgi:hypothetical protein
MFCPQCGAPNEEGSIYCGNCGAVLEEGMALEGNTVQDTGPTPEETSIEPPAEPAIEAVGSEAQAAAPVPRPAAASTAGPTPATSGLAIASLLLGIGGLTILPLLGSILAIIFGYMARREIRQRPYELQGDGMALAGIIMGWIAVGLAIVGLVLGVGLGVCGVCAGLGSAEW